MNPEKVKPSDDVDIFGLDAFAPGKNLTLVLKMETIVFLFSVSVAIDVYRVVTVDLYRTLFQLGTDHSTQG